MAHKTRFVASKINRLLTMFPVVAITGPRQCGKSTLVQALRPDWNYYDVERPDDYQLITSDPLGFFSRRRDRTIIEEAQQYPDIFKVLRGVIDRDRSAKGRFLITGSSSPDIVKGWSGTWPADLFLLRIRCMNTGSWADIPNPGSRVYGHLSFTAFGWTGISRTTWTGISAGFDPASGSYSNRWIPAPVQARGKLMPE